MALERTKAKKIGVTLFFFFIAGLCEIAGGFILFLYGVVPTFQPSHFHRIYAAYGGIFIVMAIFWGWAFEGIAPDIFDMIGTTIALAGVVIIYYMPRKREKGEKATWS